MIHARHFGAKGNGIADDTAAIQDALDAAAAIGDTVYLAAGTYAVSRLVLHDHTGLCGDPTWSYLRPGGTILRLTDPDASCLIDFSRSRGSRLSGLSLDGGRLGKNIHGIHMHHAEKRDAEDSSVIERCAVVGFSGDGIRLENVWCFNLRGCLSGKNLGSGLWVSGGDGFIQDNQFSYNHGSGIRSDHASGSMMISANRIEWNRQSGILAARAWHWQINGNSIDRSGGPGIHLRKAGDHGCYHFVITGNIVHRSARPAWTPDDPGLDCGIRLESTYESLVANNSLTVGADDGGHGIASPTHALAIARCRNVQIANNSLTSIADPIRDEGGHENPAPTLSNNLVHQVERQENPDAPENLNHAHMS